MNNIGQPRLNSSLNGISNMGGNMQGTPISQLLNDNDNNDNNDNNDTNNTINVPIKVPKQINDIKKLVNTINEKEQDEKNKKRKLKKIEYTDEDTDDIITSKKINKSKKIDTDTDEEDNKKDKKKNKNIAFQIPEIIKDTGLIWVIYLVLSINIIQKFIAKYMTSLNPNEDGVIPFKGVAAYGLILALLYLVIKFALKYFDKY